MCDAHETVLRLMRLPILLQVVDNRPVHQLAGLSDAGCWLAAAAAGASDDDDDALTSRACVL